MNNQKELKSKLAVATLINQVWNDLYYDYKYDVLHIFNTENKQKNMPWENYLELSDSQIWFDLYVESRSENLGSNPSGVAIM